MQMTFRASTEPCLVQADLAQQGLMQDDMVQQGLVKDDMVQRGLVQEGLLQLNSQVKPMHMVHIVDFFKHKNKLCPQPKQQKNIPKLQQQKKMSSNFFPCELCLTGSQNFVH